MNTDLIDAGGFTPVIDALVQHYGLVTAAIFGRVWRYSQGDTGYCYASIDKIAAELRLSGRTVITHLKRLVADGYLYDHTPGLRNKPHSYSVTKKIFDPFTEPLQSNSGVTPNDTNGMKEIHSDMKEIHTDVKEIHSEGEIDSVEERIKKESKKELEETILSSALRTSDAGAGAPAPTFSSSIRDNTIRKYYKTLKETPQSDLTPGILASLSVWGIPSKNVEMALAYLERDGYNQEIANS